MPGEHTPSHWRRYRQIATTLGRHGLWVVVDKLGLDQFVPSERRPLAPSGDEHRRPAQVRMALEELGATFIKLGQILSTRPDLLPPAYVDELAKLQDQAPPVDAGDIRQVIEVELGAPLDTIFADFDPQPLAAASIGQVHAARLMDGSDVVVKVRRPGVVEQIDQDLEILQNLAATAARHWELANDYDLVGLTQEFAQTLRSELDYVREGRNAERFGTDFAGDPDLHVPRVFWATTTSRVLTLERVRGIKINDREEVDAAGIDRGSLARRATRVLLDMVFEHGFFHADPHPGNFFVEGRGRIGLIDFGMIGTVDDRTRDQLVDLVLGLTDQDPDRLVDAFLELGVVRRRIDRPLLRQDLNHLVSRYYGKPLGDIALGPLIEEALGIVRRHHLQLPVNLTLLLKTAVMTEGLGAQLDPTFRLTVLVPYAHRMLLRQYDPRRWASRLARASLDAARLGTELPVQVRRTLAELERGELEVGMHPIGFEPLLQRFERMVTRLVLGILAAAFIVGLAGLLAFSPTPGSQQWAEMLFAVGFVIAVVIGAYLAITILRTGRL
jgi:ubiquinone biosynthesis protein